MKWFNEHPLCDFDHSHDMKPWFVDGKLQNGPWAVMCSDCYLKHGVGLGNGKGQRYDGTTLEKVDG